MFLRPDQMPRAAEQVSFSSAVPVLSAAQNVKSALEDLAQSLPEASNLELTDPLPEPHDSAQTVQEALVSLASIGPAQAASNTASVTQPGHGFVVGTQIRPTSSGWVRAQGNTIANASNVWTVVSIDGDDFIAVREGRVNIPSHGLGASNSLLYLSPTSAGARVSTKPVGTPSAPLGFYLPVIWIEDSNHIHVLGLQYPKIDKVLSSYTSFDDHGFSINFNISPGSYLGRRLRLVGKIEYESNNESSSQGISTELLAVNFTGGTVSGPNGIAVYKGSSASEYSLVSVTGIFYIVDWLGSTLYFSSDFDFYNPLGSSLVLFQARSYSTQSSRETLVWGRYSHTAPITGLTFSAPYRDSNDYWRLNPASGHFVELQWDGPIIN